MSEAVYVALLRGVNVGQHRRVPMADLRGLLGALGYGRVATYLQSGNACFTSPRDDPAGIAAEIEERIARELDLEVSVLVRTREELAAVVGANPFAEGAAAPKQLHVAFLSAAAAPDRLAAVDPAAFAPDEYRVGDRAIYVWYPHGAGRSKLTNDVWERRLGVRATTRNWNTVTRLTALTDRLAAG